MFILILISIGCPTSSGKTFISYYVMEKVLKNSHDEIVVFVAPMKALANQAAAEIYARFGSKVYPKGYEKSIYAMSMPDYTINDALNCQILITVPSCLESMLCDNKPDWISKIKYIIIDEIQTINDSDLGLSIEKIIHMARCPFLFISATISNLDSFYNWLYKIQMKKGIKLNKIVHNERFCDLKKYLFSPIEENKLIQMHEFFGYSEKHLKNDEIAEEFHLLPSEIAEIVEALEKICSNDEQKSLIQSIQPKKFFQNVIINKNDVKRYEKFIMDSLKEWSQTEKFTSEQFKSLFDTINKNCNMGIFKRI
jgi:superfamily II RNA helicase